MAKHPVLPYLRAGTTASLLESKHHFRPTLCSHMLEKRASSPSSQQEAAVQASLVPTSCPCQQVRRGQPSSSSPAEPAGEVRVAAAPRLPPARLRGAVSLPSPTCKEAPQLRLSPKRQMRSSLQAVSQHLAPQGLAAGISDPPWQRGGCGRGRALTCRLDTERAGSGKPSLVLRRRLGCVSPFGGIKQVSPFRLHALSPPRQLSSAFLAFSGPAAVVGQRGAAPCSRPPNFFLPRPGITRAAQGEALPTEKGSGHPAASPCLRESCFQQWYLGSIRGWRYN